MGPLDGDYSGAWTIDPSQCAGQDGETKLGQSLYVNVKGSTADFHIYNGAATPTIEVTGTLASDGTTTVNVPKVDSLCFGSGPAVFTRKFVPGGPAKGSCSGTWSMTVTTPNPSPPAVCKDVPKNVSGCGGTWKCTLQFAH